MKRQRQLTEAQRFGIALREERLAAGLSQAELARRLECDPSTISKWENGRVLDPPPRRIIEEIEAALGITNGRLQAAAGYAAPDGLQAVSYTGRVLTVEQEESVLDFIAWKQSQSSR